MAAKNLKGNVEYGRGEREIGREIMVIRSSYGVREVSD